jgi:hypothetical protein
MHKLKEKREKKKSDHRHETKIQNTCIYILNTTDTICGEKLIFMDSSKFINQEIEGYYLVNVDHNGMAAHLTYSDCEGF